MQITPPGATRGTKANSVGGEQVEPMRAEQTKNARKKKVGRLCTSYWRSVFDTGGSMVIQNSL